MLGEDPEKDILSRILLKRGSLSVDRKIRIKKWKGDDMAVNPKTGEIREGGYILQWACMILTVSF
jgi:hypothetical protein